MPTFIQEGFSTKRRRRAGHKARRHRAKRAQTQTSKAISDAMKFPLAMASIGAGIGAFGAVTSALKK